MTLSDDNSLKFIAVGGWSCAVVLVIWLTADRQKHENIARRICQTQANRVYVSGAYGSPCITKFNELEKLNATTYPE
jgi:hypothetical protein